MIKTSQCEEGCALTLVPCNISGPIHSSSKWTVWTKRTHTYTNLVEFSCFMGEFQRHNVVVFLTVETVDSINITDGRIDRQIHD